MTFEDLELFYTIRRTLFAHIEKAIRAGDGSKNNEGYFSLGFPDYFEKDPLVFRVHLDCYLIGPHRHYDWEGPTMREALVKADRDISKWIENWEDF